MSESVVEVPDLLHNALQPPSKPGRMVRTLRLHPGMRLTGMQIVSHAAYWRLTALEAWGSQQRPLVVLGDSLAQAVGVPDPRMGYAHQLWEQLWPSEPPAIINLSRSGARMSDVLSTQVPAWRALDRAPRAVLCTVGSNDVLRSARLRQQAKELDRLIEAMSSQDTVLACLPAKGSVMAALMNRRLVDRAATSSVTVARVDTKLRTWRGRRAPDCFHPNEDGYELWTEAFAEALAV